MSDNRPRACFAGTRLEALQALSRFAQVVAILAVPGSQVHQHGDANGLPVTLATWKNRTQGFRFLREQQVDLILSAGLPFILPGWVLQSGALFINSHPALLPAYKGKNAIREAYAAGEEYMGVTVHYMVEAVDAGSPLCQERVWLRGCTLQETYDLLFGVVEPLTITRAMEQLLRTGRIG